MADSPQNKSNSTNGEKGVGNSITHTRFYWLEFIIKIFYQVFTWIGTTVLILVTLLTVSDVFGRKALNSPVPGTVEIIEMLLVFFSFSAIFLVTARGGNIAVDIVSARFPRSIHNGLLSTAWVVGTFAMALVTWQLWIGAQYWYHQGPTGPASAIYRIPFYPFKYIAAVESGFVTFALFVCFLRSLGKNPRKGALDLPESDK